MPLTLDGSTGIDFPNGGTHAKAWAKWKGDGTAAINADGNISSLTDNGTGLYTFAFSFAMASADYVVNSGATKYTPNNYGHFLRIPAAGTYATSSVQVGTTRAWNDAGSNTDCQIASLSITQ